MVPAAGLFSRKSRVTKELHRRSDPTMSTRAIKEEMAGQNHQRMSVDGRHERRISSPGALDGSFSSASVPISPLTSPFANTGPLATSIAPTGPTSHDATATIDPKSASSNPKGLGGNAPLVLPPTHLESPAPGGVSPFGAQAAAPYSAGRGLPDDAMREPTSNLAAEDAHSAGASEYLASGAKVPVPAEAHTATGAAGLIGLDGSAPARTEAHAPDPMRAPTTKQRHKIFKRNSSMREDPKSTNPPPSPTRKAPFASASAQWIALIDPETAANDPMRPVAAGEAAAPGHSSAAPHQDARSGGSGLDAAGPVLPAASALRDSGPSGNPFAPAIPSGSQQPSHPAAAAAASSQSSNMHVHFGGDPGVGGQAFGDQGSLAPVNPMVPHFGGDPVVGGQAFSNEGSLAPANPMVPAHAVQSSTALPPILAGELRAGPLFPSGTAQAPAVQ